MNTMDGGIVDKENVFHLIINNDDPILARFEYIEHFLSSYGGIYLEESLRRLQEAKFWYMYEFDLVEDID